MIIADIKRATGFTISKHRIPSEKILLFFRSTGKFRAVSNVLPELRNEIDDLAFERSVPLANVKGVIENAKRIGLANDFFRPRSNVIQNTISVDRTDFQIKIHARESHPML
ncbi:MAG: hypothetical protein KGL39_33160 [Patescibacteria group bacterium]|nr:hypothetical protein [Patescibacteria group bacterium]